MFIDCHNHLDILKDIDGAIARAKGAGLKLIVASGINPETNRTVLQIAEKYDIVKCSLGVYPANALEMSRIEIDNEMDFLQNNKNRFVMVGEIGLDYKESNQREIQKENFRQFIGLAKELGKPVIVHSRKAEEDAIAVLEGCSARHVVMHCFSGKKSLIEQCIERKYLFTIPANIVFSEHFQMLAEICPLNQILTETDAPFLSPFRGKANEPAFVVEAVKKIAEIKNLDTDETANIIFANWQRLIQ